MKLYKNIETVSGIGANVTNGDPTICINDIVDQHNESHGTSLKPFVPEELIGRTLTCMEKLVEDFQENGDVNILDKYYEYWLHGSVNSLHIVIIMASLI